MIGNHPDYPARNNRRGGSPTGQNRARVSWFLFVIGAGLALLLAVPAQAGTYYTGGSPQISAAIAGSNEVSPGDAVNLTITVKNTGLNAEKVSDPYIATREEPPNTARFLTVALLRGDAPITIKSDPQMIGDLPGGSNGSARFSLKINSDAAAGTYTLPLAYSYTYLYASYVYENSTIENSYRSVNGTVDIMLKIKPDIAVEVLSATPDNLNAGTGGYIDLKLRNAGSDFGKKAVVMVLRSGLSPILPNDSSIYIGDFPPGGVASCRYRVFVSPEAQPNVYPADIVVIYQNTDGDYVTSRSDTVGIPVGGKVDFAIISDPVVMNPGNKRMITVEYRNTGAAAVYSAEARIVAVDPFTTSDDISGIGDLRPGEAAFASFGLTADRLATIKEYGLDSEIRYRDALNNSYVSDAVVVRIRVTEPVGLASIFSSPVNLTVAALAIIAGIALVFRYRKRIRQRMK